MLTLQGQAVPYTETYKYLGVEVHANGLAASRRLYEARLTRVAAANIAEASSAALRSVPLLHVAAIYTTYWLSRLTYEMGLEFTTVPPAFTAMESKILRMALGAPNHPLVCLRSMLGLPSLQTRLDIDKLRVFVRLITRGGPDTPVRQQLYIEREHYNRYAAVDGFKRKCKALFWHGLMELMAVLDRVVASDEDFCSHEDNVGLCPASWTAWAHHCASHPSLNFTEQYGTEDFMQMCRRAVMLLESARRKADIRDRVSLHDVADILDSPDLPPFVIAQRTAATAVRIAAWGGVRTLFPYQYRNLEGCPWCAVAGGFTVSHLVRDCPAFEVDRNAAWVQAADLARTYGILGDDVVRLPPAHVVADNRQLWYRVTMGAAVPHAFLRLELDTPSNMARGPDLPATRHLRVACKQYRHVLAVTGRFLVGVVLATSQMLEDNKSRLWVYLHDGPRARTATPRQQLLVDRYPPGSISFLPTARNVPVGYDYFRMMQRVMGGGSVSSDSGSSITPGGVSDSDLDGQGNLVVRPAARGVGHVSHHPSVNVHVPNTAALPPLQPASHRRSASESDTVMAFPTSPHDTEASASADCVSDARGDGRARASESAEDAAVDSDDLDLEEVLRDGGRQWSQSTDTGSPSGSQAVSDETA